MLKNLARFGLKRLDEAIYLHHLNGIIERDWIDFETTKGFGFFWGMNWSYFYIIKYI